MAIRSKAGPDVAGIDHAVQGYDLKIPKSDAYEGILDVAYFSRGDRYQISASMQGSLASPEQLCTRPKPEIVHLNDKGQSLLHISLVTLHEGHPFTLFCEQGDVERLGVRTYMEVFISRAKVLSPSTGFKWASRNITFRRRHQCLFEIV